MQWRHVSLFKHYTKRSSHFVHVEVRAPTPSHSYICQGTSATPIHLYNGFSCQPLRGSQRLHLGNMAGAPLATKAAATAAAAVTSQRANCNASSTHTLCATSSSSIWLGKRGRQLGAGVAICGAAAAAGELLPGEGAAAGAHACCRRCCYWRV